MDRTELVARGAQAIIRKRALLTGVTLLVFVAAVISSFMMMEPEHEAELILAVTSFRASGELGAYLPEGFTAKSYEPLLKSQAVLGETLDRLTADNVWEGKEPPALEDFARRLRVDIRTVDATTRPVTYSPYIILRARAEAGRAEKIVDAWAATALEAANRATHLRVGPAAETVARQAGRYRSTLETLWEELAREEAQGNVTVLAAQLASSVAQLTLLEQELVEFQRSRAASEREAASIRSLLADEPRVLTVRKAPSDDVYWLREAEGATEGMLEDLASRTMTTEVVNAAYTQLQLRESAALQQIAQAEAQIAEITKAIANLAQEKELLQQRLAHHTYRQKELGAQANVYASVFAEVDKVRLMTDTVAQMSGPPTDPDRQPVGLNRVSDNIYAVRAEALSKRMRIVMATVLAFLATVVYILGEEWSQEISKAIGVSLRPQKKK